jgi:hypothetical protein
MTCQLPENYRRAFSKAQADKKNAPTVVYVSGQSWVLLTTGDGCQQQMKPIPALPIGQ